MQSQVPDDFYYQNLDGNSVASLLRTIRVEHELRYALDFTRLRKAVSEGVERGFAVLHLSCHGDETGVALADNHQPTWDRFAEIFQDAPLAPSVLVMSACCGAASGIGTAFQAKVNRPKIIFGSTEPLSFSQYAVAWSILYHRFETDGLKRSAAQVALQHITAVVHKSFVYRRWDDNRSKYLTYPLAKTTYVVKPCD